MKNPGRRKHLCVCVCGPRLYLETDSRRFDAPSRIHATVPRHDQPYGNDLIQWR